MSFRSWATLLTFVLLGILIYFARDQLLQAWNLMGDVNIFIWLLIIPAQFVSYYLTGEIMFSYLRSKGELAKTPRIEMARIALELNFVNHILPSGGAAGFSYLGWVLGRHGVSAGRSTTAQLVRFVTTFASFVLLLLMAVLFLVFDHTISRYVLVVSASLSLAIIGGTYLLLFAVNSHKRLLRISSWITTKANKIARIFAPKKRKQFVQLAVIENFFTEIHQDYLEIRREKKILIRPLFWAFFNNIMDALLLFIIFWSLGYTVSPAILFIAFGLSSLVSVLSVLPAGAGLYETAMITFLASAGIPAEVAIAGTLLARVSLLAGTIIFGYVFYQLTLNRYGK